MPHIEFGVKTGQGGYTYEELVRVWRAAEELGFDSAWLYDHFYSLADKTQPCLEAWTTLAALAAETKRLKIGPMVTCVNYRHPALLAKMTATVDLISNGRLILGIGAGWHEEEYRAYGYEFPDQSSRMRQLKEALIIIRKLWTEEPASFEGQYYSIQNAICLPKPLQKPHPRILVGISRGKRTLPYLAVKYADGLNVTSHSFEECKAIVRSAMETAGKVGKKDMIISWQGFMLIGRTASELDKYVTRAAQRRDLSQDDFRKALVNRGFFVGLPDECVNHLRKFAEIGVNNFALGFASDTEISPLETFRDRVAPELR
jgi:F420-dependent oxidoreductase-like protein